MIKLSGYRYVFPRRYAGSKFLLPALAVLLLCLPYRGNAAGEIRPDGKNVKAQAFQLEVSKANETFDIPYRKLTVGTSFRLISRDPERWAWNNRGIYDGKIMQLPQGKFERIPLPDIAPGTYQFDVLVGVTMGGLVCYSEPMPLTIRVMGVDGSSTDTICSGTRLAFTPVCVSYSAESAMSYRWTRAAVPGIREGASSGIGSIDEVLTNITHEPVTVKYVYMVTANECSGEGSFEVLATVNPVIPFEIVNGKIEVCSGETTDIKMLPDEDWLNYRWEPEIYGTSGAQSGNGKEIRQVLEYESTPATVLYRVSVVLPSGNGCTPSKTTVVRLKALPDIELSWLEPTGPLMVGRPIRFKAFPQDYASYLFDVNGQQTKQHESELFCYDWKEEKENIITVSVTSEDGCWNADTLNVTGPKVNLPNVFTPGGDGVNDNFLYDPQLPGFRLEVFNRNGSQLYSGNTGWDGRYRGVLVPSGTYLYVIHYLTPEGRSIIRKYHVYVKTGA